MDEILAYDAISPDDATWAGDSVVDHLVKQQMHWSVMLYS